LLFILLKGREQDWQGHKLICKLTLANPRAFELEQLQKLQNQIRIESDKGVEDKRDPQRYSKQYRSNRRELERRMPAETFDERSLVIVHSKNLKINENVLQAKIDKALTSDDLKQSLHFTFSLCTILKQNRPICEMTLNEQTLLGSLHKMRIDCYLALGKRESSLEYLANVEDDCIFLLETGLIKNLSQNLPFCQSVNRMRQEAKQLKSKLLELVARQTETRNQRRNRRKREEEMSEKSMANDKPIVDANLCAELANKERHLAMNATEDDHGCPICMSKWSSFVEAKVAAILPCNHAYCATCLLDYYNDTKNGDDGDGDVDEKCLFQCCLCRFKLREDIFNDIARAFVDRNLLPYFSDLPKSFPFPQEYLNTLAVSKLIKHNFDLVKVTGELANFIGYLFKKKILLG